WAGCPQTLQRRGTSFPTYGPKEQGKERSEIFQLIRCCHKHHGPTSLAAPCRRPRSPEASGMNWKYKALLHLVLSRLPLRERINYFFQRFVTRNLPIPGTTFARRVAIAKKHIDFVQQYYSRPPGEATFYEYGAGW